MRVRFWGTRGSLPKPGPTTLRYGGNTSCVEVRAADGTLVILDCGTGAHGLGKSLLAGDPLHGHLLIGHTHWDHIQGFPFFAPLFVPGNVWDVYAPGGRRQQLEASLTGQMAYEYFPVTFDALHAEVRLHELKEGVFDLGNIRVTAQYLNHPALTLGYRLEADGVTVVYSTDVEPHSLHPLDGQPGTIPVHHEDRRHIRFLEGADLVIHDAQYTLDDFPAKAGWGHMPIERTVDYAMLAHVKQLALFHHDPDRHDEAVDRLSKEAGDRALAGQSALEVFGAAEGQLIELVGDSADPTLRRADADSSALLSSEAQDANKVLLVDDDPMVVHLIRATLKDEGVEVSTAADGESGLKMAREQRPGLILLDMVLPGLDGLGVCRAIRADPDPYLCGMPVIMLTGEKLAEQDLARAFATGVSDYMLKPANPTLIRACVRKWLVRASTRARWPDPVRETKGPSQPVKS